MKNKHLLLFTIGPVQSFIAQARKTDDLFTGSRILSKLTEIVMEELNRTTDCKFVTPSGEIVETEDNSGQSFPNRFIAEVCGSVEEIRNIGKKLENLVRNKLLEWGKEARKKYQVENNKELIEDYERHIENFPQIHWVALEVDENNYSEIYSQIETYMGSIKNTRTFACSTEKSGRKCSVCGERNALFFRGGPPSFILKYALRVNSRDFAIGEGEALCGVCFLKRRYEEEHASFPSTAEIALMDTFEKAKPNFELQKSIKKYKKIFADANCHFDYQLFYEENITKDYFKKNDLKVLTVELDKIQGSLKKIHQGIKDLDIKMTSYYSVVALDGDNMGKWLSGKFIKDKSFLRSFQKEMSVKLSRYADLINRSIAPPGGKVIYAGGDDILAFANINHLMDVLKTIRMEFPKFEDIEIDGNKVVKDDDHSGASCGVVIAHYKTPLSEVLKWARRTEKLAKEAKGKDTCTIAVLKHSGEVAQSSFKWFFDVDGETVWSSDLIKDVVTSIHKEYISSKFIENLNYEFDPLLKKDKYKESNIVECEICRLFRRSIAPEIKRDKEKMQSLENILAKLVSLYYSSETLKSFLNFLNIIRFIVREAHI